MAFQHLQYEITDHIAVVTIDRPPVNALNQSLVSELGQVAETINGDVDSGDIRVAIITSKGKFFCAGADLKERFGMPEDQVAPTVAKIREGVNKLANISVPTIAALQGSAFGGGFEVALAADIRLMVDHIQVGLREAALAIVPGAGGTQRLTRIVGPSNAVWWITSARLFTAQEALQQGAANEVVTSKNLIDRAYEIAGEIASCGPLAVRQAKRAIVEGMSLPLEQGLDSEFECYQKIIPTRDRLEGLNAFREKRSPKYEGQ